MTMTKKWPITEPLEFEPLSVRSWAGLPYYLLEIWVQTVLIILILAGYDIMTLLFMAGSNFTLKSSLTGFRTVHLATCLPINICTQGTQMLLTHWVKFKPKNLFPNPTLMCSRFPMGRAKFQQTNDSFIIVI
jgi:hypothetical protein